MTVLPIRWSFLRDWRQHLRWFAAEFLVVVAGILVALWLQAAWQRREYAAREASYLRQISADLLETTRRLELADSVHSRGEHAQTQILFAYQQPEPPPLDSLKSWLWLTVLRPDSPIPVTGTINGLISTGDLRLIGNDSLRAAILAYASSIESAAAMESRTTEQTVFGLKHELAARVDLAELEAGYYSAAGLDSIRRSGALLLALPGARRSRFPLDREALLDDRTLYTTISELSRAKSNLKRLRREMREETDALRRRVEDYRAR